MTCLNNFLVLSKETCQVTSKPSHNTTQITHPSLKKTLEGLQGLCWHYGKEVVHVCNIHQNQKVQACCDHWCCAEQALQLQGQRCFSISKEREPVQPGTLLKGQFYAIHLQTAMTRKICLTFLVQLPISHVTITLLQMEGITAKIEPTQNCSSFICMRQNLHTSIKTWKIYYITNFKLFAWQAFGKI